MKNLRVILFSIWCTFFTVTNFSFKSANTEECVKDQVRQTAINDFLKTKLYKTDSVFYMPLLDSLNRLKLIKTGEREYKWVNGEIFPNIIAVNIFPHRNKFFLDTTISNTIFKGLPSRYMESKGKLFFWYDKHLPVTNTIIKILDKYHCIVRGGRNDPKQFDSMTDDALKGIDYYFCRNNLSNFKKVITNLATGYYDPPNLNCK